MYALLVRDFLASVASLLALMVTLVGPIMAVYAVDILMRRNNYDGLELSDVTDGSKYWFTGGVNLAGAIGVVAGAVLALLCAYAPGIFTGPIAVALNGFDLSLPVGMLVAGLLYVVLYRALYGNPRAAR
jgi:purine-cytosine permease-like protein